MSELKRLKKIYKSISKSQIKKALDNTVSEPKPTHKKKKIELVHTNSFFNLQKVFQVTPVGKPRMTQQDKWRTDPLHPDPKKRQRKCVTKYWDYKRMIKMQAGDFVMPRMNVWIIFYIPMTQKTWSDAKKELKNLKIHDQKPDKDNLEKALTDSLMDDDKKLADSRISKLWCMPENERIEIYY